MAGRNQPPQRAGIIQLSPQAESQLGLFRACNKCGEQKEISVQTYAPSNRPRTSFMGWAIVCRGCQGRAAAQKQVEEADEKLIRSHPSAVLIDRMYLLKEDLASTEELDIIIDELSSRIMGNLEYNDELKALDNSDFIPPELPEERKESFLLFQECMRPLIAGGVEDGDIHEDIINGLMSSSMNVMILATRYSAKSTKIAIYVAWRIFRNPLMKVMVLSGVGKLAKRMLRYVRTDFIGNCPLMKTYRPDNDPQCLDAAEYFTIPQTLGRNIGGYTFTSFGIGASKVGNRADEIILDDIETEDDDSPEKVTELEEDLNEIHMINPKGRKVIAGTYQSEYSIYTKFSEEDSIWEVHKALMLEKEIYNKQGTRLLSCRSRWAAKFSEEDIISWRRKTTDRAWRLHVLLECDAQILQEKPLRISGLIVSDTHPMAPTHPVLLWPGGAKREDLRTWGAPAGDHWYMAAKSEVSAPYVYTVGRVDPAGGLIGRGDAIGIAVVSATRGGMAVIRHVQALRVPAEKRHLRWGMVAQTMIRFNVDLIVVEEDSNGEITHIVENACAERGHALPCLQEPAKRVMKGPRIISLLSPVMDDGRLGICEAIIDTEDGGELVNQLVSMQYDGRHKGHDDVADAVAGAVGDLRDHITGDRTDSVAQVHSLDVEALRHKTLREGGIEADDELMNSLLEEDDLTLKLIARKQRLEEVQRQDRSTGRPQDMALVRRLTNVTRQIESLKKEREKLFSTDEDLVVPDA